MRSPVQVREQQQQEPEAEATADGADAGAMPAKVFDSVRPTVIAGLANEVLLVKKYAAPM